MKPLNALLLFLAVAMLLATLPGCATVPDAGPCYTADHEVAKVRAAVEASGPGITYRELSQDERSRFLKLWNETPPVGGLMHDTIGYFDKVGERNVSVLFIERGCVWSFHGIPRGLFLQTIRGGTPS